MRFYEKIARPVLFKTDPEMIHNTFLGIGKLFGNFMISRALLRFFYGYRNTMLSIVVGGIKFENPVGLGAGFDKNGILTDVLPSISFGFEEIGSITGERCEGNAKPRIFRLPKDNALVVNYGLCNDGSEAVSKRLANKKFKFPVIVNIARANNPDIVMDIERGIKDYIKAYNNIKGIGDFIVINISCPNTPDERAFFTPSNFNKLMKEFSKLEIKKPVFIKLKPDFSKKEIDNFIDECARYKFISGFVISNLTKNKKGLSKEAEKMEGSVSGIPIREKSDELIKYVYKKTKGEKIIIGVGGIFSTEDAYRKIRNGASLVELITGMIYRGPGLIKEINKDLVRLLKKDGFSNIKDAIGVDA